MTDMADTLSEDERDIMLAIELAGLDLELATGIDITRWRDVLTAEWRSQCATDSLAGASVPAVELSRSTPDAVAPPAVSPEAAPPRATTPRKFRDLVEETMTPESIERAAERTKEQLRAAAFGTTEYAVPGGIYGQLDAAKAYIALLEAARLRAPLAGSPSLESGALLDAYVAEVTRLTRDVSQVETVRTAREALDRRLADLERDAARMREAATRWAQAEDAYEAHDRQNLRGDVETNEWCRMREALHTARVEARFDMLGIARALSPSWEPTTTPETSEMTESRTGQNTTNRSISSTTETPGNG